MNPKGLKKHSKMLFTLVGMVVVAGLMFLCIVKSWFYTADHILTDSLYQQPGIPSRYIKIIAVDEETLNTYGSFTTWSREKSTDLINYLMSDPENQPAVIALDVMYMGETNPEVDEALVQACAKAGNVVVGSNLVYRARTKTDASGRLYVDTRNVDFIEEPFEALRSVTSYGFVNAQISKDSVIRSTRRYEKYKDSPVASFDEVILQAYSKEYAQKASQQKADSELIGIHFSGNVGEYEHYSLCRVLAGEYDLRSFRNCIVLLGAYAPGLQDAYTSAINRGEPMNGVEVHANAIQALLEGNTYRPVGLAVYGLLLLAIWVVLFLLGQKLKKLPLAVLLHVAAAGAHVGIGFLLAKKGIQIPQLYFLILEVLTIAYYIVDKYFIEKLHRRRVMSTFKKYVAPQIVDEISKNGTYELKLGGEKKDIACLFVDIRGFTPLSESLDPEQVVGVLNEYLALTTKCIFDNNGTLDKFIGDATMAVFNAPFSREDYEMDAIRTALAIRAGGDELSARLEKLYGKQVRFGIGVNCGEAVVGNIGCDVRMDYTAIGDTVNTAARLESKAPAGEILISPMLYERVKDKIVAEQVGEMALKGKAESMLVYRVIDLIGASKESEDPNS